MNDVLNDLIRKGNITAARAIIREIPQNDPRLNEVDVTGKTPLYEAVIAGDIPLVLELMKKGAATQRRCLFHLGVGETPFIRALLDGREDIAQTMVDFGLKLNVEDDFGNLPLHDLISLSARARNIMSAIDFMKRNGADIAKSVNRKGEGPMIFACRANAEEVGLYLLAQGVDPNGQPSLRQEHPIHACARFGSASFVEALVKAGADINARNDIRQTALHIAAHYSRKDVVRILLELGADTLAIDHKGRTPADVSLSPLQQTVHHMIVTRQKEQAAQNAKPKKPSSKLPQNRR